VIIYVFLKIIFKEAGDWKSLEHRTIFE